MSYFEKAKALKQNIDAAGAMLTDEQAVTVKGIYPEWDKLVKLGFIANEAGYRFQFGDELYKTAQPNMSFAEQWKPGLGTESMYTRIDESHTGTADDPIPYGGNMELVKGLCYLQNDTVYLCSRGTAAAVFAPLSALVGIYVEIFKNAG